MNNDRQELLPSNEAAWQYVRTCKHIPWDAEGEETKVLAVLMQSYADNYANTRQALTAKALTINTPNNAMQGEGMGEADEWDKICKATQPHFDAIGKPNPSAGERMRHLDATHPQPSASADAWIEQLETTVINLRAKQYLDSGLSVDGARIHAETEMRNAKAQLRIQSELASRKVNIDSTDDYGDNKKSK